MVAGERMPYWAMTNTQLIEEALTKSVIGAFFEVYNTLGYGYYEHFYIKALQIELELRGHRVKREVRFPVWYKAHFLGRQRVDLLVDDKLIIETKSTQELHRGAARQLFSYLHGSAFEIGLLLHFGPEARFYPVACRNSDPGTSVGESPRGWNWTHVGQSPQDSDSSILESFDAGWLCACALKLYSWWRRRMQPVLSFSD